MIRHRPLDKERVAVSADLRFQVQDLYDSYVEALDDGALERWPDLFTERADYRIVSRENWDRGLPLPTMSCETRGMFLDRVAAIQKSQVYSPRHLRHFYSALVICGAQGETLTTRANFAVLESKSGEPTQILVAGKYYDTLSKAEGGLRFQQKVCVYDSHHVPISLVLPV